MKWVSFHTHTTYSYGDAYGTVEEHVQRAVDLGMSALGISEHGNVNSHAALEREANKSGIKPIFGIEAYLGPIGEKRTQAKTHITIFALNQDGYHNLNKLVTRSWEQHHYFPTISPSDLKEFNEGLVVLSGCSDSLISCTLLGGKFLGPKADSTEYRERIEQSYSNVCRKIEWFSDVVGTDRFFLEVQRFPRLERTCAINETFAAISKDTGIPLIATADVHYPRPTDNHMQAVLHAARWPSTKSDFQSESAWEMQANLSYPESDEEIINDLIQTGLSEEMAQSAVIATESLAARCTVELPKAKPLRFPGVKINSATLCGSMGKSPSEGDKAAVYGFAATLTLKQWIKDGWKKRVLQRPELKARVQKYNERVEHELKVIADKDFSDYFLAIADLVNYAKSQNITVGPGRGSAAGSVICYLLGITEIDPLHPVFRRMIFERFIDKNRTDMPDIDLDFDDEKRHMVPAKAEEIYGKGHVANVSNHITYKAKNTLRDIARAYSLPLTTFDPIAKRAPERTETDELLGDTIAYTVDAYRSVPEVGRLIDEHMDKIDLAIKLESNQHSMGTHAGGFIISSDPISDVCPIYTKEIGTSKNNKRVVKVIPYEKRDAEHLGLLKMDFLGLSTMGEIGLIRRWINQPLDDLYSLFYRDYENGGSFNNLILHAFREDDCVGIFQYEGPTTRQVVRDVQPDNFDELAACNALSRPGPLYGGQTAEYVAVKRGERDWKRRGKGFDEHVEWTFGQIVYQEQIMWILRDYANFPTDRVLRVRKIIGKKLGEHQFAELWEEFRDGCASNGVGEDDAQSVWNSITTAAGYAFNTAHAYSYALIAWWAMLFKIHNPKEFFAAALAKNGDGKDDIPRRTRLLQDAGEHEILIDCGYEPWSMDWRWAPVDSKPMIRPGWSQFPKIGETKAKKISIKQEIMESLGQKMQWHDLVEVDGISEPTIMKMIEFTADPDPFKIHHVAKQLGTFRKQMENGEFDATPLPDWDQFYTELPDENCWVAWVGMVSNIHYKDEIEQKRQKSGKTIEEIKASMDDPDKSKKATLFAYDESGECALRISRWVYPSVASQLEGIEPNHHIVVAWGRTFPGRSNSVQVRRLWVLDPD